MIRIFSIICLALLLGILPACGSGGYSDSYYECWVEYEYDWYCDCYVPVEYCDTIYYKDSETGETIVWSPDYEGAVLKVSPAQFQAMHPSFERQP